MKEILRLQNHRNILSKEIAKYREEGNFPMFYISYRSRIYQ